MKAAAIRREIEEAKAAQKEEQEHRKRAENRQQLMVSPPENVQMQSPIESKVKPLKIPMKSKMIRQSSSPAAPVSPGSSSVEPRGVPGARLRINQPAGQEIKSILRTNKSSSMDEQQQKRLSIENLPSVKSKIETYLQAATVEEKTTSTASTTTAAAAHKSILVNGSQKTPRLLHLNDSAATAVSIYAQSATDMSEEEESGAMGPMRKGMLEVPNEEESMLGLRKSRSFTSTAPVDKEKQDTVMAFFGGTRLVITFS
jgi:hypothetical protein